MPHFQWFAFSFSLWPYDGSLPLNSVKSKELQLIGHLPCQHSVVLPPSPAPPPHPHLHHTALPAGRPLRGFLPIVPYSEALADSSAISLSQSSSFPPKSTKLQKALSEFTTVCAKIYKVFFQV